MSQNGTARSWHFSKLNAFLCYHSLLFVSLLYSTQYRVTCSIFSYPSISLLETTFWGQEPSHLSLCSHCRVLHSTCWFSFQSKAGIKAEGRGFSTLTVCAPPAIRPCRDLSVNSHLAFWVGGSFTKLRTFSLIFLLFWESEGTCVCLFIDAVLWLTVPILLITWRMNASPFPMLPLGLYKWFSGEWN